METTYGGIFALFLVLEILKRVFLALLDAVDEAMALRRLLSSAAEDDLQSTADSDAKALPEFELFGINNVLYLYIPHHSGCAFIGNAPG
jgi:hypothetical protein